MALSIKKKLILGFLAVSLLTGVISGFALKQIETMDHVFNDVAEDTVPLTEALEELRFAGLRIVSSTNEYAFLMTARPEGKSEGEEGEEEELISEGNRLYEQAVARYTILVNEACRVPEAKVQYQVILQAGKKLQGSSAAMIEAIKRGEKPGRLRHFKNRLEQDEKIYLTAIKKDLEQEKSEFRNTRDLEKKTLSNANRTIVVAGFITFIIALSSGILIATTISRPIATLRDAAVKIGAGNFDTALDLTATDEMGELAKAFSAMVMARKSAEDKLRESNEEVKNFAYVVSHDLRAPLVSIKGFSVELVSSIREVQQITAACVADMEADKQKRFEELVEQDIPEAVEFIGSSVSRMERQINAILNLSRIGHRELVHESVNTEFVVDEILKSLAHQIEQHNVEVTKGELPILAADKGSLDQIFGNLIDNALKYLDPGRNGAISITAEVSDRHVTFHIADNGLGIPKESIGKIFDLFNRAGRKDVPGEGMGLAYVRALIRRNGGRIWVRSEVGVGTTFSFTIPVVA